MITSILVAFLPFSTVLDIFTAPNKYSTQFGCTRACRKLVPSVHLTRIVCKSFLDTLLYQSETVSMDKLTASTSPCCHTLPVSLFLRDVCFLSLSLSLSIYIHTGCCPKNRPEIRFAGSILLFRNTLFLRVFKGKRPKNRPKLGPRVSKLRPA